MKTKNEITKKILIGPHNTMQAITLIHTFVKSKLSVSEFQTRSSLTPTLNWRLKKIRSSMLVLIPVINENQ
jgi:hypothetical protein